MGRAREGTVGLHLSCGTEYRLLVCFGGQGWGLQPPQVEAARGSAEMSRAGSSQSFHVCAGPRPNVYAHPSAPGLVLATGNVGAHLDYASSVTCTYLSRDGGLTWEDVLEGPGEQLGRIRILAGCNCAVLCMVLLLWASKQP